MKVKIKKINSWRILIYGGAAAMTIISTVLFISDWRILGKAIDSINYRNAAKANVAALTARKNDLEDEVASLGTESGVEKEIRRRFPVAKPDEEVIMLVGNQDASTDSPRAAAEEGILDKLVNWFKSL